MFKSVFAKYITAFAMITVVSFCMILSIIVSLVNSYSANIQNEIVKSTARSAKTYLELRYEQSEFASFKDFIHDDQGDIVNILSTMAENYEGVSVILSDANGNLLLHSLGEDTYLFEKGEKLPAEMQKPLVLKDETSFVGTITNLFDTPHICYATPILDGNGEFCGAVTASASGMSLVMLLDKMIKTIIVSSIWVMVATMIAVYFITEMVTGPLREMSKASKRFASGDFSVRVPVRGNDEVAELASAFNQMATSLDNMETTRNTFLANVAHDLRTPMTTISGFIDNILVGAIPKEEQSYYLGMIKDEVRRLSRLVSSLLDITRLQAGDRKFTSTSFDVCELARLILISFEQKINEKKLDVSFVCDNDRMIAEADRDAVYQILYNICDNAVKFSKDGGAYRISITSYEKKKILVGVYNEGQGISEADLPYVFERFYKADKSRGIDKSGVGLGMFIAKTILDAHGEKIWVESHAGCDCEFFFTLPKPGDPKIDK